MERTANVLLRVPGLALLDLLYRWDVQSYQGSLRGRRPPLLQARSAWALYYLGEALSAGWGLRSAGGRHDTSAGHVMCVVLLMLPVRYLVKLYVYLLTLMLLYVGHQTARDYIRQEVESEYHGAVYRDAIAINRIITALTGQVIVSTLCSLLMKTRQAWLFSAPMLPLIARLCGIPLQTLSVVNTFATILTSLEVLYVVASNLLVPLKLAKTACREVVQVLEVYRLVALGMMLWTHLAVPLLFLVFWLVLYSFQVYFFLTSANSKLTQQGLLFIFLNSVAECCATPYSLMGLTFTVSYLALGLLNLCKFYLVGFSAFQNGNVMHRGVTEGVTLLLLALQTGLLDLQVLQRTFLLSIILFIVVTSTLQSMIEITDPIVLSLGASRNRSPWKHIRGVSMCLFLLIFPSFMAYKISRFFHMDFWLLILVSSCMLTSLQVMGTIFIYTLFMIELFQDNPLEKMDEIIYYVNAVSRVLEFLVAVCVVGYGTWESLFGEWSWMGASVIIIHSYLNVWLRAQSGWKSFLLRREAAKKINSLPKATKEQLFAHNDVCAICFQEMSVAVITICGHFFHAGCLRKWLYVQDTCPMCHQQVNPPSPERDHGESSGEDEREEPVAELEASGSEPASGMVGASTEDWEGPPPTAENVEFSAESSKEPGVLEWNEDAATLQETEPHHNLVNTDLCNNGCVQCTHSAPQRTSVGFTGLIKISHEFLNEETVHLEGDIPAAGEGSIYRHDTGMHQKCKNKLPSKDTFSRTQPGNMETGTWVQSALRQTGNDCSEDALGLERSHKEHCGNRASVPDARGAWVQMRDLEGVTNNCILQNTRQHKDDDPS
ncbi:RING finger protein 145-like isoform X1 [Pleurodeles waltl]|uniref:RING finger protein 145-like isoform X1 n=1 Tax=Pleurodeles waltl TaxID=8319 RepID=UPI0037093A0A